MSVPKSLKVIFDTNIFISFLIGKRLQYLKELISSEQLLLELRMDTRRPKLKKYFPEQKVDELIHFLLTVGQKYEPAVSTQVSRDPKDNFLLDLAEASKADYLVTGDKDLLVLNPFRNT